MLNLILDEIKVLVLVLADFWKLGVEMVGFGKCGFRNRKFLFFKTGRGMETSNKRGLESIDGENCADEII